MADARLTVGGGGRIPLRVSDEAPMSLSIGSYTNTGTRDYGALANKPSIEAVELVGNRTLDEFGMSVASNIDVINLFD